MILYSSNEGFIVSAATETIAGTYQHCYHCRFMLLFCTVYFSNSLCMHYCRHHNILKLYVSHWAPYFSRLVFDLSFKPNSWPHT